MVVICLVQTPSNAELKDPKSGNLTAVGLGHHRQFFYESRACQEFEMLLVDPLTTQKHMIKKKVKQSRYRSRLAQSVRGS